MERQFSRIEEVDKKLDSVQQGVSGHLQSFEQRIIQSLQTQPTTSDPAIRSLEQQMVTLMAVVTDIARPISEEPPFSTPHRRKNLDLIKKLHHTRSAPSLRTLLRQIGPYLEWTLAVPNNNSSLVEVKTDLESRYTNQTSPSRGSKT